LEHHEGRKREEIRVVELRGNPIPEIAVLRITNTSSEESAKYSVLFAKNLYSTLSKQISPV
jgi:hypothetical protein